MSQLLNALVLTCLLTATSHADTVYKSVDENGKVTYSSTPPVEHNDISKIKIAAPPSDEHVEAAKQRHEKNQKAAEILDENRQKRNAQIAEENRIKRERQNQLKQQKQAEDANRNDQYDHYPYYRRGGGIIVNPRPPIARPPGARPPVNLPAGPVGR